MCAYKDTCDQGGYHINVLYERDGATYCVRHINCDPGLLEKMGLDEYKRRVREFYESVGAQVMDILMVRLDSESIL